MGERISVIGWTPRGDRPTELAEELGGTARVIFTPRLARRRALVPLRYLVCAVLQVAHLVRHRPEVVVVVNPPLWPGLIAWTYSALRRGRFVLDSHPGGFGAQGHTVERRLQPLHRFLVRRAAGVLVTTEHWVRLVEDWGGTATVVHEPPRERGTAPPDVPDAGRRPVVLYVSIFAPDEPVAPVLAAARLRPDVDWWITGDPARARDDVLADVPDNVRLTGYLDPVEYDRALAGAEVVLALTTEPTSIMRAAYEAVHARRPLVVSDHAAVTEAFPHAVPTGHDAAELAASVGSVVDDLPTARGRTDAAYRHLEQRWREQLADLEALIHGGPTVPAPPTEVVTSS